MTSSKLQVPSGLGWHLIDFKANDAYQ
jgi:hypothetical protein